MRAVEIDNKKFLLELAKEVQIGEDGARKSKAALKQGTSAADKLEKCLVVDQSDSTSHKPAPKQNKDKSQPQSPSPLLFPEEPCESETQPLSNGTNTLTDALPLDNTEEPALPE